MNTIGQVSAMDRWMDIWREELREKGGGSGWWWYTLTSDGTLKRVELC